MPSIDVPAHRPSASERGDRAWRLALGAAATLAVLLVLAGLAFSTALSVSERRAYADAPAIQALGAPENLAVEASVADVRVVVSPSATEVRIGLVAPGSDELPPAAEQVPAAWTIEDGVASGRGERLPGRTVIVGQPVHTGVSGWAEEDLRDVLIVVPADLAPGMRLRVESEVGDIHATGTWLALELRADIGEVLAEDVAVRLSADASARLTATSDVGDVRISLAAGNVSPVTATSSTGDVTVEVPEETVWLVRASTDVGEVRIDPGIETLHGFMLEARSDIGDVTVRYR